MTIGERIKSRRKELGLTVDQIAEKLNKNRATIYRYESDDIESLPITIIKPLAKALNVTPAWLMGWEEGGQTLEEWEEEIEATEHLTLGLLEENIGKDAVKIIEYYLLLNEIGKEEAIKRIEELTFVERYKAKEVKPKRKWITFKTEDIEDELFSYNASVDGEEDSKGSSNKEHTTKKLPRK